MSPSRPRAFTLIEVLVSLGIFALAAVVLAVSYLNVVGAYQSSRQRLQDEEDWKMFRAAIIAEPDRAKLEQGGRLPLPANRNLEWRVRIEPTEIADLFTVVLSAREGSAPPREQRLMLLRPDWSEPGERDQLRTATRQRWEEGLADR